MGALLPLFLLLAVLTRLPVWGSPETTVGGSGADPLQMLWFLHWAPYAVSHAKDPLTTHYLNAPQGVDLLWNTTVPAAALLLWPVTALWNVVTTYNVLVTLSLGLSAWLACIAIHRYVRSVWACAAGGLVYGFSPLMSAQSLGHAQVLASAISIPVLLMLFDEALVRQRLRWWLCGLLIAVVAVFQFFIFEEYFVTAAIAALILIVLLAIVARRQLREHRGYAVRALGCAAVLTALALAAPLALQLHGQQLPPGAIHDPDIFVSDPLNFILPTPVLWLAPGRLLPITQHFVGNLAEEDAYLGVPLVILLLVTLVRYWSSQAVRVAGLLGIIIAVLSLGPHLHFDGHKSGIPLPWWPLAQLPALQNVLPSRLTMYMFLAAGILLAFALERLWLWRRNIVVPLLVGAVVLVPLVPHLPFRSEPLDAPAFFTSQLADAIPDGATVYAIPWPGTFHQDAMLGQTVTNDRFKLLGGYFIGLPAANQSALTDAANLLDGGATSLPEDLQQAMLTELDQNGVQYVMLTPLTNQAGVAAYLDTLFGSPVASGGGVVLWQYHTHAVATRCCPASPAPAGGMSR